MPLRPAEPDDAEDLRELERRAGVRFRDVGMPEVADDEPPAAEVLAAYATDGRAWIAVDDGDRAVGYVLVDVLDGCAHVEQMSVDPVAQGRGIGRALLEQVRRWAAGHGLAAVTLTTFRDVPWNAPLYAHLGFRVLAPSEVGPELAALVEAEAARGLDPSTRVCMRAERDG